MPSTVSGRTVSSVQRKTSSKCFWLKEQLDVRIFFMLNPFANNHSFLAITRELCKYDSHGNRHKTGIIIEFTIITTSMASDAAGLNMEEAVAQAKDALVHMKLAPSSLEPIQDAVDTSVAVVANIKSLSTTWGPLLDKVKLFTELVDGIAQVSG
jgi:hypothetical protein